MPKPLALLAAALLFAASPTRADILVDGSEAAPAEAERDPRPARCAAYEVHARYLATYWGESPFFTGATDEGIALQVFVNRVTGSWTALVVRRDGFSCVTGMGEKGRPEVGL
jgi:hypothetical protein